MRRFRSSLRLSAALLILTSSLAVGQVALSLSSGTATPGNPVVLNLSLNAPSGNQPAGLQWTLAYSTTDFSAISVAAGSAATAAGKTLSCNNVSGSTTCLIWGLNSNTISSGVVATVTLTVSASTLQTSSIVQVLNSVASSASGVAISSTASGATVTIVQTGTIPVTVQTTTPGASFVVDGVTYNSTQLFNWSPGSSHTLSTTSPQSGGTGIQYVWSGWSDGGSITHTVAPTTSTTYTANFTTQYYLTTAANPPAGGSISPASGWYNSGATASVKATANSGYTFSGFSGALSGTTMPQSVTMTAPQNVSANFQSTSPSTIPITVQSNISGASFMVDGISYTSTQVLNWSPGTSHTLSTTSPQSAGTGIQYVWNSWSDGGPITHTVSPSVATTFTATFATQYYLTTTASPSSGGTISPASGWYNSGSTASVGATANTGYTFAGFSGALTGMTIPQAVIMTAPASVSANFQLSTNSGESAAFVTSYDNLGAIRNNYSGWVGTQFTVGSAALNVTSLGRLCVYGNASTHAVKFASVATGQDLPGGSAVLNMAGCTPGQFVYATLPAAIVLQAGASYYLVSMEVSGGDSWYDLGPVTTTSGASVTNSVYNNGVWNTMAGASTAYVPPNFLYSSTGKSPIAISGVLNAASYAKSASGQGTAVAPGSLVQIYATLPGATTAIANSAPFPTSLGGVSATFNGTPAPISAVVPTGAYPLLNAQVPFEVLTSGSSTTANVVVTVNGVPSAPQQIPIISSAPGIFTTSENGQGQAILVNLANLQIATPSNPIPRGGAAFFYATGLGALQPTVPDGAASPASPAVATPIVLVGGITVPVLFAGQAPGYPGVNQINIIIPETAPTGDAVPLQIQTTDGTVTTSTLVTIAIQ